LRPSYENFTVFVLVREFLQFFIGIDKQTNLCYLRPITLTFLRIIMKTLMLLMASLLLTSAAFAGVNLQTIADNADLANGSATIKSYDVNSFDVEASKKADLKTIKENYPSCGPFKMTNDRRETINALKDGKHIATDEATANALLELYNQNKIFKMYSIQTNNEIDCSRMWVEVFTTDGQHLDLYYGWND
jgi:hypothetical protein